MNPVVAGIDLGGTSIKAAIADQDGKIILHRSIPTGSHDGPEIVLDRMAGLIELLLSESGNTSIQGLGVGVPGLVDLAQGITKFLPNLPSQWRDVPVADRLGRHFQCPVRIMNDVRTATLGELTFGHGKNHPNLTMAFFSIGTGIGGGVVIEGKLLLGSLGAAGELGHQTIRVDGPRCGCGNRGCLEAIAGGAAISAAGVRLMRSGLAPSLHAVTGGIADRVTPLVMSEVADRDPMVREALVDAAQAIGIAAANVVTLIHPQLVVLGGGVADLGDLLVETVRSEITRRVRMFPTDQVRVEASKLGSQAGIVGAVALALQRSEG
jgi:glucokinase